MENNILEKINFGHIDAEADPNLIRYFLETDSYKRIFAGEKMYVIGRKGTGKSAIYVSLERIRNDVDFPVAGLTFDDYPWQIHNKVKDESKSADFAYVNTWKYIILLELAKLLLKEKQVDSKEISEIKTFLQVAYGSLTPSFKEFLVDKAKRIKCLELPKIPWIEAELGKLEFEDQQSPERKLIASINILNSILQEKLLDILSSDKMYFVMFDKLDDGWNNSEEFKSSMVGLLRACRDLNLQSRKYHKMLRCVPFLRSDIYDCLQYNDKNKAYPDIEFLNWDTDSLQIIINKRISYSLGSDAKHVWEDIFDTKKLAKKTTSFNYITKRSLLRPRDIIQFCASSRKAALHNKHHKIMSDDIYEGEDDYSEFIYREFLDEAHKQCPEIEQFFEILRGLKYERFSFEDFEKEHRRAEIAKSLSSASILKTLFDYSIIGIERIGGAIGGSRFEFRYTDPLIRPEFKRSMVVHPALKKHLKLIEKRKR